MDWRIFMLFHGAALLWGAVCMVAIFTPELALRLGYYRLDPTAAAMAAVVVGAVAWLVAWLYAWEIARSYVSLLGLNVEGDVGGAVLDQVAGIAAGFVGILSQFLLSKEIWPARKFGNPDTRPFVLTRKHRT